MKRFLNSIPLLFLLVLAIACGNPRKEQDSNEVAEDKNEDKFETRDTERDADFVAEEVANNHAEIQIAQLASQKSNDAEVKNVANLLETEHSKALKELQDLAGKKSISVPGEADDAGKRKVERLQGEEKVAEFNKEWCKEMIDMHEKAIQKYEGMLDKTNDADLKAWINQTLPHLRTHLDRVKACHEKIKDIS